MLSQPVILVIDDFSVDSKNALLFAESLKLKTEGSLTVAFPAFTSFQDGFEKNEFEFKIQTHLKDVNISAHYEIIEGHFFNYLKKMIVRLKVDLLIIGESMTHPFIGPKFMKASKFINKVDTTFLIYRRSAPIDRVDVLVDPRYSMDKLIATGEEFSCLLSSDLGIVSIWEDPSLPEHFGPRMGYPYISTDLSLEQKNLFLEKFKAIIKNRSSKYISPDVHVELPKAKSVSKQLLDIIQSDHASMIVLQKHHKFSFDGIFQTSPINQLIKHFEGNILVCPA